MSEEDWHAGVSSLAGITIEPIAKQQVPLRRVAVELNRLVDARNDTAGSVVSPVPEARASAAAG